MAQGPSNSCRCSLGGAALFGWYRTGVRPQWADNGGEVRDQAGGDVEADVLRELSVERVVKLCDRLVSAQRDVLLLRLVADLTVEQVAGALGKTVGAVKQLQRRGLAHL